MTRPWLPLHMIKPALPLMEEWGVSEVARSPRGFLTAYTAVDGQHHRLSTEWVDKRNAFLARHYAQVEAHSEPLWTADGQPTRRHLALAAWAWTPEREKWKRWLEKLGPARSRAGGASSCPPDALIFYHGAQRWDGPPSIVAHRKGHAEHGPGIYLTTSWETARGYAKGGGSVYRIGLDPSTQFAGDVQISVNDARTFVKGLTRLRNKAEVLASLARIEEHRGPMMFAEYLVNTFVNQGVSSGQNGPLLAAFLAQQGVDASLVTHGVNEDWIVVFNPNKVCMVERLDSAQVSRPGFAFDLPKVPRAPRTPAQSRRGNTATAATIALQLVQDAGGLAAALQALEDAPDAEVLYSADQHQPAPVGDVRAVLKGFMPGEIPRTVDMVTVYHATDPVSAKRLLADGLIPLLKPRALARTNYMTGRPTTDAPGAGLDQGLYVGASPRHVESYGTVTLELHVPRSYLGVPPESTYARAWEALHDHNGAVIRMPVPPSAIRRHSTEPARSRLAGTDAPVEIRVVYGREMEGSEPFAFATVHDETIGHAQLVYFDPNEPSEDDGAYAFYCLDDVSDLQHALGGTASTWILRMSRLDSTFRGRGLGIRLYEALLTGVAERYGMPAIIFPEECQEDGSTSADAQNVWTSLRKRWMSSGRAIASVPLAQPARSVQSASSDDTIYYHCGARPPGVPFSLRHVGAGEGRLTGGQSAGGAGVYFASVEAVARAYCTYANPAHLSTVKIRGSIRFGQSWPQSPAEIQELLAEGYVGAGHHYNQRGLKHGPFTEIVIYDLSAIEDVATTPSKSRRARDVGMVNGSWGNAGSGILITDGKRLLLVKRSGSVHEPHTWSIPGGAIPEAQGRPIDAWKSAQKEAREELGAALPSGQVLGKYVYHKPGSNFTYTTFLWGSPPEALNRFQPRLNWEHDDWSLVSAAEAEELDLHSGVAWIFEQFNHGVRPDPVDDVVGTPARSQISGPVQQQWYHGTSMEALESIQVAGLRGRQTQGRTQLAPLAGRVYVTSELAYGLTYALGGLVSYTPEAGWSVYARRTEGALLVVDPPADACAPDEDWLGELLLVGKGFYGTPLYWKLANLIPTRTMMGWDNIPRHRRDDVGVQARTGKTAINILSKTPKGQQVLQDLMKLAPNRACPESSVQVVSAWHVTPDLVQQLLPDGSNLAAVCRRLDVEAPARSRVSSVPGPAVSPAVIQEAEELAAAMAQAKAANPKAIVSEDVKMPGVYIGVGADRVVYVSKTDPSVVIKIAFREEANLDEAAIWEDADATTRECLVPVLAHDPRGRWLIMPFVEEADGVDDTRCLSALKQLGFIDLGDWNFAQDGRALDYAEPIDLKAEQVRRANPVGINLAFAALKDGDRVDTEKAYRVGSLQFDAEKGAGGTPNSRNVNYLGFVVWIRPSEFRALCPPLDPHGVGPKIEAWQVALSKGLTMSPPMLYVARSDQNPREFHVVDHEGRHRMIVAMLRSDEPLPVQVFPTGLRAKSFDPSDLRAMVLTGHRRGAQVRPAGVALSGVFHKGASLAPIPPAIVREYSYGRCMWLAVALHERFGWPIYAEVVKTTVGTEILHAYVKHPSGQEVDILGPQASVDQFGGSLGTIMGPLSSQALADLGHFELNPERIKAAVEIMDEHVVPRLRAANIDVTLPRQPAKNRVLSPPDQLITNWPLNPGPQEVKVGPTTVLYTVEPAGLHLSSLRTPTRARRAGHATQALQRFTEMADRQGLTVSLCASPLDKATSLGRLVAFYKRFGFEVDGRRSCNALGHPWMRREPIQATQPARNKLGAVVDGLPPGYTVLWFDGEDDDELTERIERSAHALAKKVNIGILRDGNVRQVVRKGPKVVGALFDSLGGHYSFDVVVDPEHQGKGIGRWLIDSADTLAQEHEGEGYTTYLEAVNPNLVRPLVNRGFAVVGTQGTITFLERGPDGEE